MERLLAARRTLHKWDDALWVVGALLVVLGSILLTPAEAGYGTHEQLLLPPCHFRLVTHIKCPLCGMTTSFCLIARGELAAALRANVLGPIACLLVLAQIPYRAIRMLGRPLALPRWCHSKWLPWAALGLLVISWPVNIWLQFAGG